ncbi:hypothetical protein H5410_041869 [Solanum commersonii]|uniref:Uncharacterized protein n=1 Tax=Solanum commersonii TaxID=4109 RepID=A0A9J5XSS7_SOLCO|nr:hypothetical protein H5410_041869 [Solanum commersonii]
MGQVAAMRNDLYCLDSSKIARGACRIRQKSCIFGESDTGAASKVKSPRNLGNDTFKPHISEN